MVEVGGPRWAGIYDLYRLLSRRYPAFMYADEVGDYLPVFVFHTLETSDFEAKLRYLAENGYGTLNLDEAVAYVRGEGTKPSRAVVLTIDDGRLSTWSVGYPLLRKYRMRATAYVIPGYVEEGPPRPVLGDGAGRANASESTDKATVMRWSEVERLHASGVIQIESHTTLHRRVVVSQRHLGFVGSEPAGPYYDYPQSPDDREPWSAERLRRSWSLPLFESMPILAVRRAWAGYQAVSDLCARLAEEAGRDFADSPGWQHRLRAEMRSRRPWPEGAVDLEGEQSWELSESKRLIEQRLTGKTVRHFCFPHSSGTERSLRLALDAGYASTAWGLLPGRGMNRSGAGGEVLERVKHDFIFRLPGAGRKPLRRIVAEKLSRRARGETGF